MYVELTIPPNVVTFIYLAIHDITKLFTKNGKGKDRHHSSVWFDKTKIKIRACMFYLLSACFVQNQIQHRKRSCHRNCHNKLNLWLLTLKLYKCKKILILYNTGILRIKTLKCRAIDTSMKILTEFTVLNSRGLNLKLNETFHRHKRPTGWRNMI